MSIKGYFNRFDLNENYVWSRFDTFVFGVMAVSILAMAALAAVIIVAILLLPFKYSVAPMYALVPIISMGLLAIGFTSLCKRD